MNNVKPMPLTKESACIHCARRSMRLNELLNVLCCMQLDTIAVQKKRFIFPSQKDSQLNEILSDGFDVITDLFEN